MPLRPERTAAGVDPNAGHDEIIAKLDKIFERLDAINSRLDRHIELIRDLRHTLSAAARNAAGDRTPSPT